uniref:Uncharacterized protein n=1 Tax=Arundo donax TaxID=35708 RepID=A0A0A9CMY9_ARUDO
MEEVVLVHLTFSSLGVVEGLRFLEVLVPEVVGVVVQGLSFLPSGEVVAAVVQELSFLPSGEVVVGLEEFFA